MAKNDSSVCQTLNPPFAIRALHIDGRRSEPKNKLTDDDAKRAKLSGRDAAAGFALRTRGLSHKIDLLRQTFETPLDLILVTDRGAL